MSHSIAVAPARETHGAGAGMVFGWTVALATIAFLLLWLEIILQLQSEWSLNPQVRLRVDGAISRRLVVLSTLDLPAAHRRRRAIVA